MVAVLATLFPSARLAADACRWLDTAAAERAAAVADRAEAWMLFGLARLEPLRSVAVRDHGGGTAELVLDGTAVNLRDSLVRIPGSGWVALGHQVAGCSSALVPPRLAAEPFAPLTPDERERLADPPLAVWTALAEIPTVLEQWVERPSAPVEVFAEPREGATVLTVLRRGDELPTTEWGYEQPGAFVIEERPNWVRIRLAAGSGWLRRPEAEPIHPLAGLVVEGLAYLTASWDGLLYGQPGDRRTVSRIDRAWREQLFEPDEVPIEALESRTLDGAVWVRLRVTSRHCAASEPAHVWAEGWVPLAGDGGEPAVGFYSRGC